MRIDLTSGKDVRENELRESHATSHASRSDGAGPAVAGESQFAESHASFGRLAAVALTSPEVRLEKIQALKSQITAGTYQVSPEQIADAVLEQMRVRAS